MEKFIKKKEPGFKAQFHRLHIKVNRCHYDEYSGKWNLYNRWIITHER